MQLPVHLRSERSCYKSKYNYVMWQGETSQKFWQHAPWTAGGPVIINTLDRIFAWQHIKQCVRSKRPLKFCAWISCFIHVSPSVAHSSAAWLSADWEHPIILTQVCNLYEYETCILNVTDTIYTVYVAAQISCLKAVCRHTHQCKYA